MRAYVAGATSLPPLIAQVEPINVVVGAIKAIGGILSFWLKPNSPPKVAPSRA